MKNIELKCNCGKVRGIAYKVSPKAGNRIFCHCEDCQSFAKYLGTENILDENGGTDIFQMSYANIEITEGMEQVRCIKLRNKGLIRWYTDCCKTPIGNTMSGTIPFMGMIHNFMDDDEVREENLGPVRAHTMIRKDSSAYHLNTTLVGVLPRVLWKIISWKIRDRKKPNSFFDSKGNPVSEPVILSET